MKRLLCCLLLLGGCEDPLKAAQLLEEPRVLGVRVASHDDHASAQPGESVAFQLLLAGPDGTLGARLAYRACEAASSVRGVPYCAGSPFAEATVDVNGESVALDLPEALRDDGRLALLGAACVTGDPILAEDPRRWRCGNGSEALRFSFDWHARTRELDNLNPDLSALDVSIDGARLSLAATASSASCDDDPSVPADQELRVDFELGAGARDSDQEALQLSHFATSGSYERAFSFVEPEQPLRATLFWRSPRAPTPVKHYLVVRDGRGGVSWISFNVCVR